MTDTDNVESPRPTSFSILGRDIPVQPLSSLNSGQVLGFAKLFQRYRDGRLDGQGMVALDHAFSKLLLPEDNRWLDWQVMEGAVEMDEVLAGILSCIRSTDEGAPPRPVKGKKKAVRRA